MSIAYPSDTKFSILELHYSCKIWDQFQAMLHTHYGVVNNQSIKIWWGQDPWLRYYQNA